jgi:hypothetical protein
MPDLQRLAAQVADVARATAAQHTGIAAVPLGGAIR